LREGEEKLKDDLPYVRGERKGEKKKATLKSLYVLNWR